MDRNMIELYKRLNASLNESFIVIITLFILLNGMFFSTIVISAPFEFNYNSSINYKPISFKVDVPGGVKSVKWINAPAYLADSYLLETQDGVNYKLIGFTAYRAILDELITSLDILVSANSGLQTTLNIPINLITDPAPVVSFVDSSILTMYKGQQIQLPISVTDPGRNLISIIIKIFPSGETPTILDYRLRRDISYIARSSLPNNLLMEFYSQEFSYTRYYSAQGVINSDSLIRNIIYTTNSSMVVGNYDLYIEAVDSKGNVSYSNLRSLVITEPAINPVVTVSAPDYRIPAGQSYKINYDVKHLEYLDRIEVSQSSPDGITTKFTKSLVNPNRFAPSDFANGQITASLPNSAVVSDIYNLTITVFDINGKNTTKLATISVGDWGERDVIISNAGITNVDATMDFANVTVSNGATLQHVDGSIKYNNLTIDAGAIFLSDKASDIGVNGVLLINGNLTSGSYVYQGNISGAMHGGDGINSVAYGSFTNPQFSGAYPLSGTSYLDDINITATQIIVNGSLRAESIYTPGGVINIVANSLDVIGLISSNATNIGSGGSININTVNISGAGIITSNGNDADLNGAGGRISILYTQYGDNTVALKDGMTITSYPGVATANTVNKTGTGTVFLKKSTQLFGELYIDNGGRVDGSTTLRSISRQRILDITLEPGTTDQYRITTEKGRSTTESNIRDLGLKGLQVSLNATDKTSESFPVVQKVLPINSTTVQASGSLTFYGFPGSVVQHNFTIKQGDYYYLSLSNISFSSHAYLFNNNNGVITAADEIFQYWNGNASSYGFPRYLPQGDYTLAVGAYFLSVDSAIAGIGTQYCPGCRYTLDIYPYTTKDLIVTSNTDITSNIGNDIISVIQLDKLFVSAGAVVKTNALIKSRAFDVNDINSFVGNPEFYSQTQFNITDSVFTAQNKFFVGDVIANNLTLDAANIDIYGSLNVAGDLTIQNTSYPALNITASGVFAAANTTGSVVFQNFTVAQNNKIKISTISIDSNLTIHIFKDDGVLDATDLLKTERNLTINTLHEFIVNLDAGNYILAIGQDYMNEYVAVSGLNSLGGGDYSYTITNTEIYGSELVADNITISGNFNIIDTALSLGSMDVINIATDLNLSSLNSSTVLSVPDADSTLKIVYPLNLNVVGAVNVDANSTIDLTAKGYPDNFSLGFKNAGGYSSHGGEGGVYSLINPSDLVYGDYVKPNLFGSGGGYTGIGGGLLNLSAASILLDGKISADGYAELNSTRIGGTGGSIFISTPVLNGTGSITANAASNQSLVTSSGGRVSVLAQLNNFIAIDQYSAIAGLGNTTELFYTAAPGTLYLAPDSVQPGHLIINNTRALTPQLTDRRTILRSVGVQVITNVVSLANNDWLITVANNAWTAPSDSIDGLGLIGLKVDLDESNETGSLYSIVANTSNTITVNTLNDLSVFAGNSLIGVTEFSQLTVLGGGQFYTEDRLLLVDPSTSILDSNSKITVGQMNSLAFDYFQTLTNSGIVEILQPFTVTDLNLTSVKLIFTGGLTVTNSLTIGLGASLTSTDLSTNSIIINEGILKASTINVTDITMTGGLLETENVNAIGNVVLLSSAIITVPDSTDVRNYSLNLNVTGQLNIELGSMIDLNHKGYTLNYQLNNSFNIYQQWSSARSRNYGWGCHGGRSFLEQKNSSNISKVNAFGDFETCIYGDYKKAQYPATVNSYADLGGGHASIIASDLVLNGIIRANGDSPVTYTVGSAGGGIHIDVATFSGTGKIETRGGEDVLALKGTTFQSGAGGRISVYHSSLNTFTGTYDAGTGSTGISGEMGSAGTVYIKDTTQNLDSIIVDNFNRIDVIATPTYPEAPTVVRNVGRHQINAMDSLGAGLWRVHINSGKQDNVTASGTLATPQSVSLHNVTVNSEQQLYFNLSAMGYTYTIYLFLDDGTGTLNSINLISGGSTSFISTLLQPGNYIVAVTSGNSLVSEVVSGSTTNTIHTANDGKSIDSTGSISYDFNIKPLKDSTWRLAPEKALAGMTVSLDANNAASALYSIVSNTAESITINSGDVLLDLSASVGKSLIGVHILDTMQVRGKTVLDFGNDRLTLLQPLASSVEAGSVLIVGDFDVTTFETLISSVAGKIVVRGDLQLNLLNLVTTELEVQGLLTVNTDLTIDASKLTADTISVGNNMNIINGGLLTVPDTYFIAAGSTLNKIHNLLLNVTGTLTIDSLSSRINLEGKGYPALYSGPDFIKNTYPLNGCAAGLNSNAIGAECSYGRYQEARFAGSGGGNADSIGGGIIKIVAAGLINNGIISANGLLIPPYGDAAGGSIHIEVDTSSGTGSIQANGDYSSGGGRISVRVSTTDDFTSLGIYSAISSTGGAGTEYITSPIYPNGYLIVDNGSNLSKPLSTPVRSVGRHTISSATRIDTTHVEITVAGIPGWKTYDPVFERGLDGIAVDLDARDQIGALYPITSNTTTSITIDDSNSNIADLTTLIGLELIGTHTFDRLQITNGASVDFGSDRVIINNPIATDFLNANHIRMGEMNLSALDVMLSQLTETTTLELLNTISPDLINLSNGNVIIQNDLNVATNLTINNTAKLIVNGSINVTGDISIGTFASLNSFNITSSNVLIDGGLISTSILNVSSDITILSTTASGILTAPLAKFNPNVIYPLEITAGNSILVDTGSSIDVNGKGYPASLTIKNVAYSYSGGPDFNYWNSVSCHAGKVSSVASVDMKCTPYGRMENALFAGSSGARYSAIDNGNGGGIIRIKALTLNNIGVVSADGIKSYRAGAGGSIDIQVNSLTGTGVFSAVGGALVLDNTNYRTGGGGRISINLPDSLANGINMANVQVNGGSSLYSNSGAGTVYLKYDNELFGNLSVDNAGVTASTFSTPIREIGRYIVSNVVAAGIESITGDALYELQITPRDAVHLKFSGVINEFLPGTVNHHLFTIDSIRDVDIEVTTSEFDTHVYLFKDDGASLIYIANNTSSGRGNQSRLVSTALAAGNYVVAISANSTTSSSALNRNKTRNSSFGYYSLSIDTLYDVIGDTWHATDSVYGWGLDGLKITLDPNTAGADLYRIVSNTENTITVASPIVDLTTTVVPGTTEFMGVHEFETINITGGAQVDFGVDRVIVNRPLDSVIDIDSALTADPASVLP